MKPFRLFSWFSRLSYAQKFMAIGLLFVGSLTGLYPMGRDQLLRREQYGVKELEGTIYLRPLQALTHSAQQVAHGQLDSSIPTDGVGEIGELVVSGPTLMKGYFKNKAATEKTIQAGELYTGDMGYIDEDGDIWLVQRRSDIIVTGGENVYPAEVEKVYRTHPAITAVCVVGVPDSEWGQAVAAMLVLEKPGAVNAADLIKFGRQQLAGYKVPRLIQFASALPLTASGKIHRQAVQDLLSSN